MHRMSVVFSDDIFEKIERRQQEKRITSIGQCIRELIELGLRIEEAAKNAEDQKDHLSDELRAINELKEMVKSNMGWSMETRMLARVLVKRMPNPGPETNDQLLAICKEKASAHIKGVLKEDLE